MGRVADAIWTSAGFAPQLAERRPSFCTYALTGTPLENRIDDLASICEFLQPWQEGDASRIAERVTYI